MVYKLYVTEDFYNDVNEVCLYIEHTFKLINASVRLKARIIQIFLREKLPKRIIIIYFFISNVFSLIDLIQ